MKLLVVDDEEIIREDLVRMIRGHYPDLFEFLQAENGLQAINIATATDPDLILSDIKMPVLSGLEMLRRLRAEGNRTILIFFSGFDDFSFVREAMKLGAVDYLLKPISEMDLFGLLDHFLENSLTMMALPKKSVGITREKLTESSILQQYVIDELLSGRQCPKELLPFFPEPCGTCVIVCEDKQTITQKNQTDWLILAGHWKQSEIQLILYPLSSLSPEPDGVMIWGAGTTPEEALQAMNRRMTTCFYDIPAENGPEDLSRLISRIAGEVCLGHRRECFNMISILMKRASARQIDPESLRQTLYSAVYTILQHKGSFVPVFSRMQLTENDLLQNVSKAQTACALEESFAQGLSFMMDEVFGSEGAPESYHIERARKYILTNYTKDLTLAELAEYLNLNPNYVSTLFHKECSMSFSQYLRTVRIDQACRLLRETTEKVYLIGEKVGYDDPVHFSRIFHEQTGLTPKEYRRKSG